LKCLFISIDHFSDDDACAYNSGNMAGNHFQSLPRELRDLIYSYTTLDRIQLVQMSSKGSLDFYNTNGLLLANHQLRDEALDAFYRLLPRTIILAPRNAQISFLSSPQHTPLRLETQMLVIKTTYRKRNLAFFALSSLSNQQTNLYLSHLLQSMPALCYVTCEVSWEPSEPPAVLLPCVREEVLAVIRWVTLRNDTPEGWDIECQSYAMQRGGRTSGVV
jgi:hypothetical protein